MVQKIDNQQDYNLSNNQIQVIVSGIFGDGHISMSTSGKSFYSTSCIYEEYIDFKANLLEGLLNKKKSYLNMGYKERIIYEINTSVDQRISNLQALSIEEKLSLLDDLGLAMWFYDDGSLHKKNLFFNLSTHSFSEEIQRNLFIPFFEERGMKPKIFYDKKKDGRIFPYLYFGKHFGAYEIMQILSKFPIECYKYKLWSPETIQEWSKLKAQLKSEDIEVTSRGFENILLGKSLLYKI